MNESLLCTTELNIINKYTHTLLIVLYLLILMYQLQITIQTIKIPFQNFEII